MNKNGKVSTLLIFLIPVFFVIAIIIFDTLFSYISTNKFKKDTENIIKEVVNNNELFYDEYPEEIKRLYEKKGYNTDMLVIDSNSYEIHVENEYYYFGLLSSLKGNIGKSSEIKILGMTFKMYKNSKIILSVDAKYNDGDIEFNYTK